MENEIEVTCPDCNYIFKVIITPDKEAQLISDYCRNCFLEKRKSASERNAEKYVREFFITTLNKEAFGLTEEFQIARTILGHKRMQEIYDEIKAENK